MDEKLKRFLATLTDAVRHWQHTAKEEKDYSIEDAFASFGLTIVSAEEESDLPKCMVPRCELFAALKNTGPEQWPDETDPDFKKRLDIWMADMCFFTSRLGRRQEWMNWSKENGIMAAGELSNAKKESVQD
jgi:hypothetical protein